MVEGKFRVGRKRGWDEGVELVYGWVECMEEW